MTPGTVTEEAVGADMFRARCDGLVVPVNSIGVMGKGLAKMARGRFPEASGFYERTAKAGRLAPGGVLAVGGGPRLYFAATKAHWRDPSRLEWITLAAADLVRRMALDTPVRSLGLPALGAGLGELGWEAVRPILLAAAEQIAALGVDVHMFPPHEARHAALTSPVPLPPGGLDRCGVHSRGGR
jgi:O-acetyl-ADP-ribose deacetylase (regulator of RNase III)